VQLLLSVHVQARLQPSAHATDCLIQALVFITVTPVKLLHSQAVLLSTQCTTLTLVTVDTAVHSPSNSRAAHDRVAWAIADEHTIILNLLWVSLQVVVVGDNAQLHFAGPCKEPYDVVLHAAVKGQDASSCALTVHLCALDCHLCD
jgi:hypothetical protein